MNRLNMDFWREVFEELVREVNPNDAWRLTMDRQLDFHHVEPGWEQSLLEHAHARFTCSRCFRNWSSHQVVILFHMHWKRYGRQGQVKMRFFGQQCQQCSSNYEEPLFSEKDVDNVLSRLILDIREKCYGENVDRGELSEVIWGHSGPHRPHYCQACYLGIHHRDHGWPAGTGHHGRPQSPGHSWATTKESNKASKIDSSIRNSSTVQQTQPPTEHPDLRIFKIIVIFIFIFIFIFIAYLKDWFK
ncbi:receptor-transporting protein 2-like [Hemicordylus capensis]|uniref:receptor-transporting protein 2-like n=1 Tax=Hemicordylus capensis TaxID=884348 RepID=UPI002304618E|nr:receptor-transporting protein 2-like [Hemicordylus capensis]